MLYTLYSYPVQTLLIYKKVKNVVQEIIFVRFLVLLLKFVVLFKLPEKVVLSWLRIELKHVKNGTTKWDEM